MKVEFRCIGCGRDWSIEQPGRRPSCRDCGGELVSQATRDRSTACPSCGQAHSTDDAFCHYCGLALRDDAEAPSRGDRERAVERRLAGVELGRHHATVRRLQRIMGLWAFLFVAIAIYRVYRSGGLDLESMGGLGLGAMFVFGTLRVKREPLLWTLTLAGLATASFAGIFFRAGPVQFNGAQIAIILSTWAFVPQASRLQQILRDHPELSFDQRFLSRPNSDSSRLRVERRMAKRKGEVAILVGILAAVLLASSLLFWFVIAEPPGLGKFPERFETAWNASGSDELLVLPGLDTSSRRSDSLTRQLLRRGWFDRRPTVGSARSESIKDKQAELVYLLDREEMKVSLVATKSGRWEIKTIELPYFSPPTSIWNSIDDFEKAWAAGDLTAMADFWLGAEKRDAMVRYYERKMTERNWLPLPPTIEARNMTDDNGVQAKIEFRVSGRIMETVWEYRHPRWRMRKIAFPR